MTNNLRPNTQPAVTININIKILIDTSINIKKNKLKQTNKKF